MQRDFTHVSDIVSGILGALAHPADGPVPHRVFNLGNHTPVELERFISVIEQAPAAPRRRSTSHAARRHGAHDGRYPARTLTLSASMR
jgi:nucleoside-diphosphate-sugar epimerase